MTHSLDDAARFAVAPMLDWSDRHGRFFWRLLTHYSLLYSEMITQEALLHGQVQRLLAFTLAEKPLALQLGGSDPKKLAHAARLGEDFGYDEINLNVGCPSARVQSGAFGACLMATPDLVGECVVAMTAACRLPITVKSRIGIDHEEGFEFLEKFALAQWQAGSARLIVHARKAWLHGLSPRENRSVPPLRHEVVYQLKQKYPNKKIILNGGIRTLADAKSALMQVDGVMLGRAIMDTPYLLAEVDHAIFGQPRTVSRQEVLTAYLSYLQGSSGRYTALIKPLFNLYHGVAGGKHFRQGLSAVRSQADAVDFLTNWLSATADECSENASE
jgi:tRNA-dihydrouridine synthase A